MSAMDDFWKPQPANYLVNEDGSVERLCLLYGFGAVMTSAARQWKARDPVGALTVGGCVAAPASADLISLILSEAGVEQAPHLAVKIAEALEGAGR